MRYRPEIDGLRAVAVIPVVLYHAGIGIFPGGFVGVDVFFVISGYLITTLISAEIESGSFSIARFYERRARRILPALLAVCVVSIPAAWTLMTPLQFKAFSESLIAVNTFSSNILFWRESGYFDAASELKPLLHTWSLAVEEQFYVLFPLLLLALRKPSSLASKSVLSVVTIASFCLTVIAAERSPSAAFYLIPTRAWELGIGSLIAVTNHTDSRNSARYSGLAATAGLLLILYSALRFDQTTPYPSLYTAMPVLGTAIVIRFACSTSRIGRVLSWRPTVAIGLISYSLYLWHQPLLAFVRLHALYTPTERQIWLTVAASIICAALSWRFVERPYRNRETVSPRILAGSLGATAMALTVLGFAGYVSSGFSNVSPERAANAHIERKIETNFGLSSECEGHFTTSRSCRTAKDAEVLLWGDSFAMHLADALVESHPGIALVQMTKSVCGPLIGIAPVSPKYPTAWAHDCIKFNNQVMAWVKHEPSVKYAVLASPFDQYLDSANSVLVSNKHRESWSNDRTTTALASLEATIRDLRSNGISPIVVAPPPNFGPDIGQCLMRAAVRNAPVSACDFSRAAYEKNQRLVIEFLKEIEREAPVIWLSDFLCDRQTCVTRFGNTFIYRDSRHLSHEGSAALGRRIGLYDLVEHVSKTAQATPLLTRPN